MNRQDQDIKKAYVFPDFNRATEIEGDLRILRHGQLVDKKGGCWEPGCWSLTKEEALAQVKTDLDSRRNELQEQITTMSSLKQKLDHLSDELA